MRNGQIVLRRSLNEHKREKILGIEGFLGIFVLILVRKKQIFIFLHKDTAFYNSGISLKGQFINKKQPLIMGILNVTEDSFFVDSRALDDTSLLKKAESMLEAGADILDVGACSTRPGSKAPAVETEATRLVHALNILKKEFPQSILSADTYRASVAEAAIKAGATIINDISGGTLDKAMFDVLEKYKVTYILMHIQGEPATMQINPEYKDVRQEVYNKLEQGVLELKKRNITDIIIDPGFGFGKTIEHNFTLLHQLESFHALGYPLLCGFSRKGMIHKVLNSDAAHALNGTTVLNTIALLKGASILRVHDVKEAVEVRTLVDRCLQPSR